jgi:N-acetylneuraminate synthase/N,N'-diacetyllegionaminate synthase
MVEKHFTLDKNLPGPDHRFSADPAEFCALVESVRTLEKSLGNAELTPAPSEELGRRDYRLSCVAARELPAGHRLGPSDIAFRRPGVGFPPKEVETLIARVLLQDVPTGHIFSPEDFA